MMTSALPDPPRHTCGTTAYLPDGFVTSVLAAAPAGSYSVEDVERHLRCNLEEHTGPFHHGLAMELHGREARSVWALWDHRDMSFALLTLSDCPAATADGMQSCTEFDGHPGGHAWELTDPIALRGIFLQRK